MEKWQRNNKEDMKNGKFLKNLQKHIFFGKKKKYPKKLKSRYVVRPWLVYINVSWTLTKWNKSRIIELWFLRKIQRITWKDRIRKTLMVEELKITPIKEVIDEGPLSWLEYTHRMIESLRKFMKVENKQGIK